jgi:dTDP-4-dehydrorhamnose 3,5-epimerase/RmlD substrate binding domain
VRTGSPTFGRHVAVGLNRRQLWLPRGFAHGVVVRSDSADFFYKSDELYDPSNEFVLRWNDTQLGNDWGCDSPTVSARDREGIPPCAAHGKLAAIRAGSMRILLTGASGQIGGALLPRLQSIGKMIAPDSKTLDLAKPDLFTDTLDRFAPQLVINPAAYTAVDQAEDDLEAATAVNV